MKTLRELRISGRTCVRASFLLLVLVGTGLALMPLFGQATGSPENGNDNETTLLIGTLTGTIPNDFGPPVPGTGGCVFEFSVTNSGHSNVLGDFIGTAVFRPNVCDGSYTGTYDWRNSRGDRMSGPFIGHTIPTTGNPALVGNTESALITGGAGRLRHASGLFVLFGEIDFGNHTFNVPYQGIILNNN